MLAYTAYKQYKKHQAKKANEGSPPKGQQQRGSSQSQQKPSQHSQSAWTLQEKSALSPALAQKLLVLQAEMANWDCCWPFLSSVANNFDLYRDVKRHLVATEDPRQ